MPVSGTFALGAGCLVLDFDRPLQATPLDLANWALTANLQDWTALTMQAGAPGAHQVTGTYAPALASPAADRVSYSPPPHDVVSLAGTPAIAFVNFPLTLLP